MKVLHHRISAHHPLRRRSPVPSFGTAELLEGVVARARKLAADSERADVASEVQALTIFNSGGY